MAKETNLTLWSSNYLQSSEVSTISEALGGTSKALSVIGKENGKDALKGLISLWLINLCKFFSVGKQMGDSQVKETAKLIAKDYYFLKIDDLVVFGNKFKSGHYGQIFDRIDGNVIIIALSKYCEERIAIAETENMEKHKELKQATETYVIRVNNNYVRDNGDNFQEVEKRELATEFSYGVAYRLKGWLAKEYYQTNPKAVKIESSSKPTESLFDFMAKKNPELLPAGEKYKRATSEYFQMKTKILADESLTDFEKQNALRTLAGIEPLTIQEYNEQLTYYSQNI